MLKKVVLVSGQQLPEESIMEENCVELIFADDPNL